MDHTKEIVLAGGEDKISFGIASKKLNKSLTEAGFALTESNGSIGSQENLNLLYHNRADIGLVHANAVVDSSWNNNNSGSLSTLAPLYISKLHILTRIDSIQSIMDITSEHKVIFGPDGSGTKKISKDLFESVYEIKIEHRNEIQVSRFEDAIDSLKAGKVDVVCFVMGTPVNIIKELKSHKEIKFVDIPYTEAAVERRPYLIETTIDEALYGFRQKIPFPYKDIHTLGITTYLVASPKFSKESPTTIKRILDGISAGLSLEFDQVEPLKIKDQELIFNKPLQFPTHLGTYHFYNGKSSFLPLQKI